jgi:hypothetical protein
MVLESVSESVSPLVSEAGFIFVVIDTDSI